MHFSRCTGWEVKIFAGKVVVDSVVENIRTSQYQCSEITQNQKSSVVIRKLSLTITQSQNCVRKLSSNDRKCFFFKIRFFHTHTQKKVYILSVVTKDLHLFISQSVLHSNQEVPWLSKGAKRIFLPISLFHCTDTFFFSSR